LGCRFHVGRLALFALAAILPAAAQTTGRITGRVTDPSGAVVVSAEVTAVNQVTAQRRQTRTDGFGDYAIAVLPTGIYSLTVSANGFRPASLPDVRVAVTETTVVDVRLAVGSHSEGIVVNASRLAQVDGPQLGRFVDSRTVGLPLASRNFTQILSLSPGTATYLPDSTGVGRNTQAISVNGARVTQNNYQINGVDANTMGTNGPILLALPAPETIQEFKIQTSMYDAAYGRAGGANIQILTRSGSNAFHGSLYEYFRNHALNANNPFLKAAGVERPVLRRNAFGGSMGGPIRKDRAFFFVSYQGTRETNGASLINSISSNVLVAPGLTDDRSEPTLLATFPVAAIHPAALALLNAHLPDGRFAIPTPAADGRYTGSDRSTFQEDQFNANLDLRVSAANSVWFKFFFANTTQDLALPSFRGQGPNVPDFGSDGLFNNRLVSVQDVHVFSERTLNEIRLGYYLNRANTSPELPLHDSDLGIARSNAAQFHGLPMIRIAPNSGGVIIGAGPLLDSRSAPSTTTAADTLTLLRGRHTLRIGAEVRYNLINFDINPFARGQIDFQDFNRFLTGVTQVSILGSGISHRSWRAFDYNFFFQDDWKLSSRLTLNLGLRYELDLPTHDTRGRLATFDPALYEPRSEPAPLGPPVGGFVEAGNVISSLDSPEVPNVGKGVVRSTDPDNFAPRIGAAWSPLASGRLVVRGGYGLFYSRPTFQYASLSAQLPPFYVLGRRSGAPLDAPFFPVPPAGQFPTLVAGVSLSGTVFDRNLLIPYFHQFNFSLQHEILKDTLLELAYVGTRGRKLFRQVAINQSRLASPQDPIVNDVTGAVFITNSPADASLRAPFQGVSVNGFDQIQSTAESSYDSLQFSATRRLSRGLQFLAAYTWAKSIDNASGTGGGAGISGVVNTGAVGDTSAILGNQLDPRANRGVSDFDRTHRLVLSYLWDLPTPGFARNSRAGRFALGGWQVSGILVTMSGLPVDVADTGAGSFYGLSGGASPLARPSFAPGADCAAATRNVPEGYFFNPFVFARPTVTAGQAIPSSNGAATAAATGTDIGNIGRNCLRGPRQTNLDLALGKHFPVRESLNVEFRAEFFNLFNQVNYANPISNLNAALGSGGSLDAVTGQVINAGNFGRIISTSNNPRIVQLALKLSF